MKRTDTLRQFGFAGAAAAAALALGSSAAAAQTPTQVSSPNQTTSNSTTGGIQTGTGGAALPAPTPNTTINSNSLTGLPGIGATSNPGTALALPGASLPSLTPPPPSIGPSIAGSGPGLMGALTANGGARVGGGQLPAAQPGATFTLKEVVDQAHANEPTFLAAAATVKSAHYDVLIAKASLLPTAIYHNQYLFTKAGRQEDPNGTGALVPNNIPIFIANNAVHEYVSQASVTETLGAAQFTAVARAGALEAVAKAELEISRRGLTSTVVGLFYNVSTSDGKILVQQRALAEANDFLNITKNRETAREVAHADVIKAQVTQQQRQRDLMEAKLLADRARIDLGILLYADPRTPFNIAVNDVQAPPDMAAVEAAAASNPELASAVNTLKSRRAEVTAAKVALLPDVVLNYAYGIDNTNFAITNSYGLPTLGYSASATVDVPVWDWFAGINRIHQATLLRDTQASILSATQRTLIARLAEYEAEAQTAYTQIKSLQDSADAARESLRLTKLRYSNGEALVLEVTDAQNTLITSELALTDGISRYRLALANIELLTGTI